MRQGTTSTRKFFLAWGRLWEIDIEMGEIYISFTFQCHGELCTFALVCGRGARPPIAIQRNLRSSAPDSLTAKHIKRTPSHGPLHATSRAPDGAGDCDELATYPSVMAASNLRVLQTRAQCAPPRRTALYGAASGMARRMSESPMSVIERTEVRYILPQAVPRVMLSVHTGEGGIASAEGTDTGCGRGC